MFRRKTQFLEEEEDYRTNRQKTRTIRQGFHWCYNCDADLVSDGGRCGTCGKRDIKNKDKK